MPEFIKPFGFILLRVTFAMVTFLAFWKFRIRQTIDRKDWYKFAICGFFGVAFNMLTFFQGLSMTTPINGAVIMLTTPALVVLFGAIIKTEKPSIRNLIGLIIALTGAFFLVGGLAMNFSGDRVAGDLLVLVNAASLAIYFVYVKGLLKKYHPITVTAIAFFFGWFMVLPFGLPQLQEVEWGTFTQIAWIGLVFVVVFTTIIAYFLNAWAMSKTRPSVVSGYIYLQPVFTTIISISADKDVLTLEKIIFAVSIFCGIYLINSGKK
jgi:drug/metabolite transporter (DMT)-like permease